MNNPQLVFRLGLALLLGTGSRVFAQEAIGLNNSNDEMTFQGTGTQVVNVIWQTCDNRGCTMEGSASGTGPFGGAGAYKFSASTPTPFKLVGSSAIGLFSVDQSSDISFSYTSPKGNLAGLAHFISVTQNPGSVVASMVGKLQVTGGSFGSQFATGPGDLNLTLAVGKNSLATLADSRRSIKGVIDALSSVTPPSSCGNASRIASTLDNTQAPRGGYIWFNANFSASGIQDGTAFHFQGGFIQFQTNGKTYVLHVPDAVITFSSSVHCATTSFDSGTDTWETKAPVTSSDEVFLSGLTFPVPPSGFEAGINGVDWSESFASNTPGVSIQWKWGAAVFTSFSTDYNSLGVKATHQNDCITRNDDHAGSPERFLNLGGSRGGASGMRQWSESASVQANCP